MHKQGRSTEKDVKTSKEINKAVDKEASVELNEDGRGSCKLGGGRECNKLKNITMLLILLIGGCCGWLCYGMFGESASKLQIIYVSRSEIMDLEKERLAQEKEQESHMFFGEINKAIALIRQEAIKYEDKNSRLIFVGDGYVEGKNTKSISKIVYEKVINRLKGVKNEQ